MISRILNNKSFIFAILTILILLSLPQNSRSAIIELSSTAPKDRIRQCDDTDPENIKIEGLGGILGDDVDVDVDNVYCASQIGGYYATFKGTQFALNLACKLNDTPSIAPSLVQDMKRMAKAAKKVGPSNPKCSAALAISTTALAAVTAQAATTQAVASYAFDNSRVCGSDWKKYDKVTMQKILSGKSQDSINWMNANHSDDGIVNGKKYTEYKEYREWYNGGEEKEYAGCIDPNRTGDPAQRYYFRGFEQAVYNCEDYNIRPGTNDPRDGGPLTDARRQEYRDAYNCCQNISHNHICIEYDSSKAVGSTTLTQTNSLDKPLSTYDDDGNLQTTGPKAILCEATVGNKADLNKLCTIDSVQFWAKFVANKSMICASSYSLCPYNFNLGGGNLQCDPYVDSKDITQQNIKDQTCGGKNSDVRDNDCSSNGKGGKCKNYCQPLEHCVVIDQNNYIYNSNISSPYFSSACIDFKGDSKNERGYGLIMADNGNQQHFSAPIAQCVRETVENIFFNKAGHTLCKSSDQIPDADGNCSTPQYIYKKGEFVEGTTSFFNRIQSELRLIIQLVLTLSVMFTGYKVMSGNQDALKRKELISYVIKLAVIMYFVTGQAWQTYFFNGIYRASDSISTVIFKITVPSDPEKRDGCQFGTVSDDTGGNLPASNYYPPGKDYLAIWDTMDCKIAYYLGMGMNGDFKSFALLILASFLTGAIGVAFAVLLLMFGVTLIVATIRMLHIFLISAIATIILVYVSIITIPLILFKKTEDIFNKWLTNLISLAIQPIILFAYIGIFVAVFDNILVGSAIFYGEAPRKEINCDDRCYDPSGALKDIKDCDITIDKLVQPTTDSMACIVSGKNVFKNWPALEVLGIGVPLLANVFTADGHEIIIKQAKTILKGTLLLFILASFIGQIPQTSQALIGGVEMRMSALSVKEQMKKLYGGVAAAAQRGRRGTKKAGQSAAETGKSAVRSMGSKGKSSNSQ